VGGVAGRDGQGCRVPWPGRCLPTRCAQGRSAAPKGGCQFGAVLPRSGVAGAQGADQGRQLQWIGRPSSRAREKGHAFGLVGAWHDARNAGWRTRGRSPYGAAFVAGLDVGRQIPRRLARVVVMSERGSDVERSGETERIKRIIAE